jgi:2-aminoadipate transaminase
MPHPDLSDRAKRMEPSAIRAMTKLAAGAGPDLISLAGGMPDPATFPLDHLAEIAASEIRNHHGRSLQYGMTAGYRPLLEWIRGYLHKNNIECGLENLMCTTGSQQALDLITEVLIDPGDLIFVETPTYIGALAVFKKSGGIMVPVAQDDNGIVPEDLEEKLRSSPADKNRLIYLISNFQNPSGVSISAERRKQVAEIAQRWNAFIIEDDPYREIYFDPKDPPAAPIATLIPELTFYLGTFSKIVAPTFRTGWITGPEPLLRKVELAKEAADLCSSMLDQRILKKFCDTADFEEHLNSLRVFYEERGRTIQESLSRTMPEELSWTHPSGGFFVWVKLPETMDSESFLEEAISKEKVSYIIGRPFTCDNSAQNYLRLAFSAEPPERIKEGVNRLSRVIKRRLESPQRHKEH